MVRGMQADTRIQLLLSQLNTVIVGKSQQVSDCVACLLAGGHLLIEDVPGVGKTTLAHALARSFGLQFSRVQFTADLMPSDLVGVSIYERGREDFVFHPGPVFAQVLLADEINRASPKTQSALLEAMEEKQVTVEGETRALPEPFFVIATQNPHDQLGTYALPESQLDRFHMRLSIGFRLGFYSVLLSHIAFSIPIVVLMVLPKLEEMNENMITAAKDLGANNWQVLKEIILPSITPGILAGYFMAFTYSIDDFAVTFFVTGNGFATLSVEIYSRARQGVSLEINALSTILFLVAFSLVAGYYFIQRQQRTKRLTHMDPTNHEKAVTP